MTIVNLILRTFSWEKTTNHKPPGYLISSKGDPNNFGLINKARPPLINKKPHRPDHFHRNAVCSEGVLIWPTKERDINKQTHKRGMKFALKPTITHNIYHHLTADMQQTPLLAKTSRNHAPFIKHGRLQPQSPKHRYLIKLKYNQAWMIIIYFELGIS